MGPQFRPMEAVLPPSGEKNMILSLALDGQKYVLLFCQICAVDTELRSCDGKTKTTYVAKARCTHGKRASSIQDGGDQDFHGIPFRYLRGKPAIAFIRDCIVEKGLMGTLKEHCDKKWAFQVKMSKYRGAPPLEPIMDYRHSPTCFHGASPTVKIQCLDGIFGSIYFKRCHGLYVNALGEELEGENVDGIEKVKMMEAKVLHGEAKSEELAETAWKERVKR